MARQVTENLDITGCNRFDLTIEEVEERIVAPGVPPLVQGNWAEVDDVGQGAIGAGAEGAGRHHSLAPPPEIVRGGEGIGGKLKKKNIMFLGSPLTMDCQVTDSASSMSN